jgi:hypothetical protein
MAEVLRIAVVEGLTVDASTQAPPAPRKPGGQPGNRTYGSREAFLRDIDQAIKRLPQGLRCTQPRLVLLLSFKVSVRTFQRCLKGYELTWDDILRRVNH